MKDRIFKEDSDAGDTKQKVMVVLIPVLFMIMVFMYRQVLTNSPQNSEGASHEDKIVVSDKKDIDNEIEWQIPEVIQIESTNPEVNNNVSRNNTLEQQEGMAGGEDSDSDLINVKSILYSDDKPSVVIGNKIIYISQEINGAILREIHKDYIIFEKDGVTWTQKVFNESFDEIKSEINMEEINLN